MALIENIIMAADSLSAGLYILVHGDLHNQIVDEHIEKIKSGGGLEDDPRINRLPYLLRMATLGRISLAWSSRVSEQALTDLGSLRKDLSNLQGNSEGTIAQVDKASEELAELKAEIGKNREAIGKIERDVRVRENEPTYLDEQRN